MKTAIALLAVLVLAAASGITVQADDHTYVSNDSSLSIRATTSYIDGAFGRSQFQNRLITPGTSQSDEYTDFPGHVQIELWVDGSSAHQNVVVDPDNSIVGLDNSDGSGVDIYLAVYGTLHQITGGVLITIYP